MKASLEEEYRASEHWFFRARRRIFGTVLDAWVDLPPGGRVLDLGPGSGVNVPVLLPRGRLTVVDVSVLSLSDCASKGAGDLVLADAARPPFAQESFDLVCALDILEHLAEDAFALREARRILKQSGYLLVSVPAFGLLWGRQDVLSEHHRRYRRGALRGLLERAGFRVERLTYFNFALFPPILAVRLLMRPFLRWTGRGGSDLTAPTPLGLDRALYKILAAEGRWLRRRTFPLGVSLLALARPAGSAGPDGHPGSASPG